MENNLLKQNYWNSYFAKTNKGQVYELDNIIIYNEQGKLIETSHGWFDESNNYTGEQTVKNDILKVNVGNEEKHIKEKHNFLVKTQESYKDAYTLYIYYKNIDYQFKAFTKDSLFINIEYTLFNNHEKVYSNAIGQSNKFSQAVYWKLREELKQAEYDAFKYDKHIEELDKHIKNLKKLAKQFVKVQEEEKNYPFESFINDTSKYKAICQEMYDNNKKLQEEAEEESEG